MERREFIDKKLDKLEAPLNTQEPMGLFTKSTERKEVEQLLYKLQRGPREDKAAFLLMAYSTRGIRLIPDDHAYEVFKNGGMSDDFIEKRAIRVYHYQPGNEVGIIQFMTAAESAGYVAGVLGLKVHLFTNLCLTLEDLKPLVRELWETLFDGMPILSYRSELGPIPPESASRDVSADFFVADHHITRELEQRKSIARRMGFGSQ